MTKKHHKPQTGKWAPDAKVVKITLAKFEQKLSDLQVGESFGHAWMAYDNMDYGEMFNVTREDSELYTFEFNVGDFRSGEHQILEKLYKDAVVHLFKLWCRGMTQS